MGGSTYSNQGLYLYTRLFFLYKIEQKNFGIPDGAKMDVCLSVFHPQGETDLETRAAHESRIERVFFHSRDRSAAVESFSACQQVAEERLL